MQKGALLFGALVMVFLSRPYWLPDTIAPAPPARKFVTSSTLLTPYERISRSVPYEVPTLEALSCAIQQLVDYAPPGWIRFGRGAVERVRLLHGADQALTGLVFDTFTPRGIPLYWEYEVVPICHDRFMISNEAIPSLALGNVRNPQLGLLVAKHDPEHRDPVRIKVAGRIVTLGLWLEHEE